MSVAVEDENEDIRSKPVLNMVGPRDWKDTILTECLCGSGLFYVLACFDPDLGEISGYYTDAICYGCGGWVKVPTPIDKVLP